MFHDMFLFQRVVDFEESEAQLRPAEKDANLFKKICQDVRQLFSDIAKLKEMDSSEVKNKHYVIEIHKHGEWLTNLFKKPFILR